MTEGCECALATTKIVSIRVTEANAIAYIANPDKTNNG